MKGRTQRCKSAMRATDDRDSDFLFCGQFLPRCWSIILLAREGWGGCFGVFLCVLSCFWSSLSVASFSCWGFLSALHWMILCVCVFSYCKKKRWYEVELNACETFVLPHKVLVIVDVYSKICVFGLAVVFGLIESRVFCRWPWQEKSGWNWSFTGHHSMSLSKTACCALYFSRGRALRHCEEQWTIKSRFKWDDLDQLKWMCLHWSNG